MTLADKAADGVADAFSCARVTRWAKSSIPELKIIYRVFVVSGAK